ncbi:Mur ligase family protein, partial [Bifidobacterium moukalabense]
MSLTLAYGVQLLSSHHLLDEVITPEHWSLDVNGIDNADVPFAHITYDTRAVREGTLLVCKGRFQPEFLDGLEDRGLVAYVSERDYSDYTDVPGLIVNDARKALSLLSAAFYGMPQNELKVIGITGTKGKTTTAYFTQAILNAHSDGRCAMFSSVDNCLDGHTYVESELTTPESLDAFRMMREAADNGMRYLVMEVSSQAYKVDRVHGLTFDVGAFLNISPDHISDIEHPTFED